MKREPTVQEICNMRRALIDFHGALGCFRDSSGLGPRPNSPADREMRSFSYPDWLEAAYSQADLLIEVTADHCMALAKTLVEPCQTIAPWLSVRGSLESAALSSWLLDPGLSVQARVARSLSLRYEGLAQQKTLVGLKQDSALVAKLESRIDDLAKKALSLGYPPVNSKRGKRIGIAQIMPSATDCVELTLGEGFSYRLLSAMAHGHTWAITQGGFEEAATSGSARLLRKSLATVSAAFLIVQSATILARPVWYQAELYGYETEALRDILEGHFDHIGIATTQKQRFWR